MIAKRLWTIRFDHRIPLAGKMRSDSVLFRRRGGQGRRASAHGRAATWAPPSSSCYLQTAAKGSLRTFFPRLERPAPTVFLRTAHTLLNRFCQILNLEKARKLLRTRTCERRDSGARRETTSEGRVRRRSRTCGMLCTPPRRGGFPRRRTVRGSSSFLALTGRSDKVESRVVNNPTSALGSQRWRRHWYGINKCHPVVLS